MTANITPTIFLLLNILISTYVLLAVDIVAVTSSFITCQKKTE